MGNIELKIEELAKTYSERLAEQIQLRLKEMEGDDISHHLIYQVLGITKEEGKRIDAYQNKGRFLYRYVGSFLEEATIACFEDAFASARRNVNIANRFAERPKRFEIDCLVDNRAYEIKWRDATTDGDHIIKEHNRVKSIQSEGFVPIRIMFYEPNREGAIRVQRTLRTVYLGVGGEYYSGAEAWEYIKKETDVDLLGIFERIAKKLG